MTDLGPCSLYLDMSIRRDQRQQAIYIFQRAYIEKMLKDLGMWESNPTTIPIQTAKIPPPDDDYLLDQLEDTPFKALAAFQQMEPWLQLWHERMGHLGKGSLQQPVKMSTGMDATVALCPCEACAQGRSRETPHKTPIKRGTYPMEFLHTDVGGPFAETDYDGSRYWVTILDDFTQMAEIHPIQRKSDVPNVIQRFICRHETPERRCKRFRMDLSGENNQHQPKLGDQENAL